MLTEAVPMLIEAAPCQYDDALVNKSVADVNKRSTSSSASAGKTMILYYCSCQCLATTALYNGRSGKIRSESSSMIAHEKLRPLIRNRLANTIEW